MRAAWGYNPAMRLGLTLFCIACFLLGIHKSACPFPTCLGVWLGAAVLVAALELLRARRDRLGDDEYLRRQLAGNIIWRGSTAWETALMLMLIALGLVAIATVLLTDIDLVIWLALGVFSGKLVGYRHWRAHWQRLQEVAARDEQSRAPMVG